MSLFKAFYFFLFKFPSLTPSNISSFKMPSLLLLMKPLLLLLLLLINPPPPAATGTSKVFASASRPMLQPNAADYEYTKLKPNKGHENAGERGVEACLPKGFRPSSAPSRYINNQPLVVHERP